MPALVGCILQQCSFCHSQIFLEFDHSFRQFCQSVRLYFASNGSARRRNILNHPLALLGRIWNRAAACGLNDVERFTRFPSKPYEDRYHEHGGSSNAGTAVHSNKLSFPHQLSLLLNDVQKIALV